MAIKKYSYYVVPILLILIGALCLLGITKSFKIPKKIPFSNVEIDHRNDGSSNIRDYAIKIEPGKFLFAIGSPEKLDLGLEFSSAGNAYFHIKPLYPNWICRNTSINQAYLSLISDQVKKQWQLKNNQKISFKSFIRSGEKFRLSIENQQQDDCGRAEITIERKSNHNLFFALFIIIWLLVFAALIYLRLPVILGATGIIFNVTSVYANASLDYLAFDISANSLILSVSIVGLLVLIHSLKINRYVRGVVSTVLTFIVFTIISFYIGNYLLFQTPVSTGTVQALIQSNITETYEFVETYIGVWIFLVIIIGLLTSIGFYSFKQNHSKSISKLLVGMVMLLPTIIIISSQSRINPMYKVFHAGTTEYFQELSNFKKWKQLRVNTAPLPDATLSKTGHTTILILGESANKNHMSLYGYPRETTPNVDFLYSKNELIGFTRAYASYSHTGNSIAHSLTQADQYTTSSWTTSPSIISLSNSLGIETTWITNQQTFGAWDNQVSVLAKDSNIIISKNKNIGIAKDAKKYDGVLLPSLVRALEKTETTKLIVMHLQGSHASYCNRFPDDLAVFENVPLFKRDFGRRALNSAHGVINCYDNSISYTDQIIKDVIDLVQNKRDPVSLLYFADHSEDVFGGKGHNKDVFTFEMVEIPMFFWANTEWQKIFPLRWKNLHKNSKSVFTNDHVFETLTGIIGIESPDVDARNDLSSSSFETVDEPLTFLRHKKLADIENWRYWQYENSQLILSNGECSRLLPHRANTVGKIKGALNTGLCGFEIDVLLKSDPLGPYFSVGHDEKTLTDTRLDYVLGIREFSKTRKIWLDIKKVSGEQIPLIVQQLDYLDKKYNLKSKIIVETNYFGEQAKLIADAGYQLSYYLPTGAVMTAIDQRSRERLARKLIERTNIMQPSAISFDLRLYSFVKNYLEPSISERLDYHTWFPEGLSFSTPRLTNKLLQRKYYKDPRVKTILISYLSPFEY